MDEKCDIVIKAFWIPFSRVREPILGQDLQVGLVVGVAGSQQQRTVGL